jgi:hypothetical protein
LKRNRRADPRQHDDLRQPIHGRELYYRRDFTAARVSLSVSRRLIVSRLS